MRTVKATIDKHGNVTLLEPLSLDNKHQALVTILETSTESQEMSLLAFLNDLASAPVSQRNPSNIEADIQAERNAWE